MKTKQQKYEEAAERNIQRVLSNMNKEWAMCYEGLSLDRAKERLGIRLDDHTHDDDVRSIIARRKQTEKK